jgi:phosphopantetheinyl transferase
MAPPNPHLVAGTVPLVGRVFEAAAGDDPAPATDPVPPRLPFVGAVLSHRAGSGIAVARRLRLDEDLFLLDHDFVHAPGIKPPAERFPVLPLTAGLELMAETAACLAPGLGLVGIDDVTARRWIAVADGGALDLRADGTVHQHDGDGVRIKVEIRTEGDPVPAAGGTLRFGRRYAAAAPPIAMPPTNTRLETGLDAARLYAERHLFHGPRFQGLHGTVEVGPDGARARVRILPAHDWFASTARPQLLCDPAALDTVGQLLAVWSMQQGLAAFPIGLARLDLHGPAPAPGTLVPLALRITGRQLKMVSADVEIGDGAGGTWLRIAGWKAWQFHWSPQLTAFQRAPARSLLSEAPALAALPPGHVCRRMTAQALAGFDPALLARHYLCAAEMGEFAAKARVPQRQLEWLLGRVAAKDAVRAWRAGPDAAGPDLHPAAFAIASDAAGQPRVDGWPAGAAVPRISIAHSGGGGSGGAVALALAGAGPVGIDVERIVARDAHCLAAFTSAQERRLLDVFDGAERDAWITRLWCAKEAFGKRLGRGVDGAARQFEVVALAADGSLHLCHGPSGSSAHVATVRDGDAIVAIDAPPTIAISGEHP